MQPGLIPRGRTAFAARALLAVALVAAQWGGSPALGAHAAPARPGVRPLTTWVVPNYYPYSFANDRGLPDGFSVELAKAVVEAMGAAVEVRLAPWAEARAALEAGTIDFLPMTAYSVERDKVFDFTAPHTIAYDALFTRKGGPRVRSLDDLKGKSVLVMGRDAANDYVAARGSEAGVKILTTTSLPDALARLDAGRGDAALMPKIVGLSLLLGRGFDHVDRSPAVVEDYDRRFSFAVKEGDQRLLERLSQGLVAVKTSGQYRRIYDKWFSAIEPRGIPAALLRRYVLGGLGVVGALVLGQLYWSRSLRRLVAARTHDLEARTAELRRSNEELQQFAYIASHDLQEPLRMIASYLQLIERRYGDRLDQDGHEFLGFAVEGAKRLQSMITGLLDYSRVESRGHSFAEVDTARALEKAVANLQVAVDEGGAVVTGEGLPTVRGDESQLVQLFQNLVANAVKFRGPEPPRVVVSARRDGGEWVFSVRDNGIGIAPRHHERIFRIFQRLHGRETPGIGLGLSICRRVVERHGGRLWAESEEGRGATFHFTVPVGR